MIRWGILIRCRYSYLWFFLFSRLLLLSFSIFYTFFIFQENLWKELSWRRSKQKRKETGKVMDFFFGLCDHTHLKVLHFTHEPFCMNAFFLWKKKIYIKSEIKSNLLKFWKDLCKLFFPHLIYIWTHWFSKNKK